MKSDRKPAAAPKREASNIRWTDEDWELLQALQKKTGIRSVSDLVRSGIRALAEKEKLR